MDFRILGPLEVIGPEGSPMELSGPKTRTLLVALLLARGRVVPVERLVRAIWGEDPPDTASKTLQTYVLQLRRVLEPSRPRGSFGKLLAREGHGYRLDVQPEAIDAWRFEHLTKKGRQAIADSQPDLGARLLSEGLALWRGSALSGFADADFARAEAARLDELRLCALEDRIEANLAVGRHVEVVAELTGATQEHPLRERLWGQLMVALYRSGRQGEALRAYQRARAVLRDELGVNPGPSLRSLEAAVLAHDPALDLNPSRQGDDLPAALDCAGGTFVGRIKELQKLNDLHRCAVEGTGHVSLVIGDEGMGKTRTVSQSAREWASAGSVVMYGRAQGPNTPLQAFVEALPALRSFTDSMQSSGGGIDASGVAAAILRLVERRAGGRGAVVVLDDLHRSDDASLKVLLALAERCRTVRVLVVALSRSAESLGDWADGDGGEIDVIELGPLSEEEVTAIARQYLGSRTSECAAPLLLHARGNPLRVHREAAHLARAFAARRIGDAYADAARARRGLDDVHRDIVSGVLELQRLRYEQDPENAMTSRPAAGSPGAEKCPYKGLAAFEFADSDDFYGREDSIAELVARLASMPFLAVVGPSGIGKSSLVRAGLLPALRAGLLPGAERWTQLVMSPGARPLRALMRLLGSPVDADVDDETSLDEIDRACGVLSTGPGFLLFVDQMEEAFTTCPSAHERELFLQALVRMCRRAGGGVSVVVAVRSDYYGHALAYGEFASLLATNQVPLGALDEPQLLRTIVLPARRAGLSVEQGLARAMVGDVMAQPGGLPLLSTALMEAWEHRQGRVLRLGPYDDTGGVRGAVTRLAESAYESLTEENRSAARAVLAELATWDDGTWVRRRVPLTDLKGLDPHADQLIATLADRRLVTTHEGGVEVAHEALLTEWPRLRAWLGEDLELEQLRTHLRKAAQEWDKRQRDPSELYRGARLAAALQVTKGRADVLDDLERTFIDESRTAAERESVETRRRMAHQIRLNRRLRTAVAALVLAVGLVVLAARVAVVERKDAETQALRAQSRGLGAVSLVEPALDRALLLALEANRLDDSLNTRSSLLANLLRSPQAIGIMSGGGNRLLNLALSPDGSLLAGSDNQGKTYLWDTASRRRFDPPLDRGAAISSGLTFSPDGSVLATTGGDSARGGWIILWDIATRTHRGSPIAGLGAVAHSVAFSGDGARVAAADAQGKIAVWDLATRSVLFSLERKGASDTYVSLDASGQRLISSDVASGGVTIWDITRGRQVRTISGTSHAHAPSPDGMLVAAAARDHSVHLYDVATGEHRATLVGHSGPVMRLTFSPDGRSLATTSDDRSIIVWDVATGAKREVLLGHAGRVLAAAFSPDGGTLYTNGLDDKVFVWDLSASRGLARRGPGPITKNRRNNRTPPLAISPDLSFIAASSNEDVVELRSEGGEHLGNPFGAHQGRLNRLAFSSDGSLLAITSDDGTATIWETKTQRHRATLTAGHAGRVTTVAFSPGDRIVATGGADGRIVLWDVTSGKRIGEPLIARDFRPAQPGAFLNLSFSPDGRWLSAAGIGGDVAMWSVRDRTLKWLEADSREAIAVAFAPDSRTLATGGQDAKVWLWDVVSGRRIGRPLEGHAGFVTAATFGPDRVLATAGTDGTIILWDTGSRTRIGSTLPPPRPGEWRQVMRFSPNGQDLSVLYDDGQVLTWGLDPQAWRERACNIAGRNLTRDEWITFLDRRAYRTTCPKWPT